MCLIREDNIFSILSWREQTLIYPPRHICPMWQWLQNGPVWEEKPSVKISPQWSIYQLPQRDAHFQEAQPSSFFFFSFCLSSYLANWQHQWDLVQSLSGPGRDILTRWETVIIAEGRGSLGARSLAEIQCQKANRFLGACNKRLYELKKATGLGNFHS